MSMGERGLWGIYGPKIKVVTKSVYQKKERKPNHDRIYY